MTPRASQTLRRMALLAAVWGVTGCVYYNGVYNAQRQAAAGDSRLRRGEESEAEVRFRRSAESAESVLVRHPASRWRERALYLAGTSAALGNSCTAALPRLTEYLARPGTPSGDRDRARLAVAVCDVRAARLVDARHRLDSLVGLRDVTTARAARRWAARAALAQGDFAAVPGYLGDDDAGALPWELVGASVGARVFTRVESLVVARARVGEYRDEALVAVRELAAAGELDGAARIVAAYDAVRVRDQARGAMHHALGEQLQRVGRDSLARLHLQTARELAVRDTIVARDASARVALIDVRRADTPRAVDSTLARLDSAVLRTATARRLTDPLLLLRLLAERDDPTGASLFLAAEVARDSLRAPLLARTMFVQVAREHSGATVAPTAWYAASLLDADSAEVWRRRVLIEYPASPAAARLRGEDPAALPDFAASGELLRLRWTEGVRVWSDSLRRLRAATRSGTP